MLGMRAMAGLARGDALGMPRLPSASRSCEPVRASSSLRNLPPLLLTRGCASMSANSPALAEGRADRAAAAAAPVNFNCRSAHTPLSPSRGVLR